MILIISFDADDQGLAAKIRVSRPIFAMANVRNGGGFRVPSGVRKPFMQEPAVCTC